MLHAGKLLFQQQVNHDRKMKVIIVNLSEYRC